MTSAVCTRIVVSIYIFASRPRASRRSYIFVLPLRFEAANNACSPRFHTPEEWKNYCFSDSTITLRRLLLATERRGGMNGVAFHRSTMPNGRYSAVCTLVLRAMHASNGRHTFVIGPCSVSQAKLYNDRYIFSRGNPCSFREKIAPS